jgi:hypothetical protein
MQFRPNKVSVNVALVQSYGLETETMKAKRYNYKELSRIILLIQVGKLRLECERKRAIT